jgi:hypothetical protein
VQVCRPRHHPRDHRRQLQVHEHVASGGHDLGVLAGNGVGKHDRLCGGQGAP